jgi:predicted dehydrogenase
MSDSPLRLGYVGGGFMAQNVHLPNFASLDDCELVALAELRPKLAQLVARRFGIARVHESHHELAADSDIDAVGVSGAFDLQGEIAADLLRAGKHVFMEKPMAVSVMQSDRILAAAAEGNARLMVGYHKRHDPGNELARTTIADWRGDDTAGRPTYARSHCFTGNWLTGLDLSRMITTDEDLEPRPRFEHLPEWLPEQAGLPYVGLLQNWTHNVNLLRFLLGAGDNAHVRLADLDAGGGGGVVVLEIDGIRAIMEIGVVEHHHWDEHTQVYFERGWVRVETAPFFVRPGQSRVEIYEGGDHHSYHRPLAEPLDAWPYREEAAMFVDCLRTGAPFRSSGEDTATDVRIFEEVYRHHLDLDERRSALVHHRQRIGERPQARRRT